MADIPQTIPEDWAGSIPEYYAFWALLRLGYDGQFEYQEASLGGRLQRGGTVIDFYIPDLNLAIMVQSVRFHYANPEQNTADTLIRATLTSIGYRVVYIDEEDILQNPIYYILEALKGIDHSRFMGH